MGKRFKRLSHTDYGCKYHVVFGPKYQFSTLGIIFAFFLAEKRHQSGPFLWPIAVSAGSFRDRLCKLDHDRRA